MVIMGPQVLTRPRSPSPYFSVAGGGLVLLWRRASGPTVVAMARSPHRVVIAGGGIAGLEALLALRALAGDRVELTLVSAQPDFVYRPLAVARPFGLGHARRTPLAEAARDAGATLKIAALESVDPGAR